MEAYFALNRSKKAAAVQDDASPPGLLYQDTPLDYTWSKGKWLPRKRSGFSDRVIGRLYAVGLKDGERYFLRVLLQHLDDLTSYEDLRLVRGPDLKPVEPSQHHDTFQQAALAVGSRENVHCMELFSFK